MSVTLAAQPFENLALWERLQLFVGDGPDQGIYDARVEEFLNGGIVISQPVFQSGAQRLRENCPVRVIVTRQDALYEFDSTVRRFGSANDGRAILTPPRSMQRIQRRLFVRLAVHEPARIAVLSPAPAQPVRLEQLSFAPCTLKDISGGGALLQIDAEIPASQPVLIDSPLFAEWNLPRFLLGRTTEMRHTTPHPRVGIEFLTAPRAARHFGSPFVTALPEICFGYDQRTQDKLVTRVFHEQVKLRQKGLL